MWFSKKFSFISWALTIIIVVCCIQSTYGGPTEQKTPNTTAPKIKEKTVEEVQQLFVWNRSKNVEYPKVWHKFNASDLNSNKSVEYHIADLDLSRIDEACDHLRRNYFPDEPLSNAFGVTGDEEAINQTLTTMRGIMKQKMVLVCHKANSTEILGVHLNYVCSENDTFFNVYHEMETSKKLKLFVYLSYGFEKDIDPYEEYDVKEYLGSIGLSVDKRYRGRGIAENFLIARKEICERFGIKLASFMCVAPYLCKCADKIGYKTDDRIPFKKYSRSPKWAGLKAIAAEELLHKIMLFK